MCEDMEEAIREQLEASKVISDAVRDACFQPWSDPFVRTTAYEIPLEKYPSELGMAISQAIMPRFPDEGELGVQGACCIAVAHAVLAIPVCISLPVFGRSQRCSQRLTCQGPKAP